MGLSYSSTIIRFQELDIRRGFGSNCLGSYYLISVRGFIDDMLFLHDCFLFSLIILRKLGHFPLNSVKFSFVECVFALLIA